MYNNIKKNQTLYIASGGLIAALYLVLTIAAAALGLDKYAIQLRFSEALTILPVFTAAAIPGLAVGCVLTNILTGCVVWDVVFGSLATLLGAIGTRMLRNRPYAAWIPPVVSNTLIVPIVLMYAYGFSDVTVFGQTFAGGALWPMMALTVAVGEIISCGLLGMMLYQALKKAKIPF